jgi:hypothetical protein
MGDSRSMSAAISPQTRSCAAVSANGSDSMNGPVSVGSP